MNLKLELFNSNNYALKKPAVFHPINSSKDS